MSVDGTGLFRRAVTVFVGSPARELLHRFWVASPSPIFLTKSITFNVWFCEMSQEIFQEHRCGVGGRASSIHTIFFTCSGFRKQFCSDWSLAKFFFLSTVREATWAALWSTHTCFWMKSLPLPSPFSGVWSPESSFFFLLQSLSIGIFM